MERRRYVQTERGTPVDRVDDDGAVVHDDTVVRDDTVVDTGPAYAETVTERRSGFTFYDSLPARINTVLFAGLTAIEALLALRFALLAFGANRDSGFVDFIMDLSYPFAGPFFGVFTNRTWDEGIIELNTLLAMGVWLLVFSLAAMLVNALVPRTYDDGTTGVTRRRVMHH